MDERLKQVAEQQTQPALIPDLQVDAEKLLEVLGKTTETKGIMGLFRQKYRRVDEELETEFGKIPITIRGKISGIPHGGSIFIDIGLRSSTGKNILLEVRYGTDAYRRYIDNTGRFQDSMTRPEDADADELEQYSTVLKELLKENQSSS